MSSHAQAAKCCDCGLPYSEFGVDVVFPHNEWAKIATQDELICANCIANRVALLDGAISIKARLRTARTKEQRLDYTIVYERAGGRCEWCGSRDGIGVDHMVPKSRGGKNAVTNYQLLCRKCGLWKSNDDPKTVVRRIDNLKPTSHWSRSVRVLGLEMMSTFIEKGNARKGF